MAEDQAALIHGDVLEETISHVPLLDLLPASHVSKAWQRAVFSSLPNRRERWLIVYTQGTRSPYATTAHAYDHRSDTWIEVQQPSIKYVSTLRSSHSNLLYMLSPSRLSFSFDPLHLTWHHAEAPLVWRADPIVAVVGRRVVVAGGTCDFDDDPFAVEIYNFESRTWDSCESMPSVLKDSSASTWLSIASDNRKLFVMEKHSGVTYTFDPETKTWCGPYDLRPNSCIFYSVIAFSDECLILLGLIGDVDNVEGLKLWRVNCESFKCEEEIGEMPLKLLDKLKREAFDLSSISVCLAGNMVHVYNPSMPEEVIACEIGSGGWRWRSVRNVAAANDRNRKENVAFTCSKLGIEDLQKALRSKKWRLCPYNQSDVI